MAAGRQSHTESMPEPEYHRGPEISVCEGSPETCVFLESGNTDGWLATDLTVDVFR